MTKGVSTFVGARLEEARLARGLTQTSLAQMVGKNSSSVSSWESGRQFPEWDSIEALSSALLTRSALFFHDLPAGKRFHYYRSNSSITAGLRKKARARLRWAEIISDTLQEWIDFPEVTLPGFDYHHLNDISNDTIELAANECRAFYSLGGAPIEDAVELVESAGAVIVKEELDGQEMDGLSVWCEAGSRPFIMLSDDKSSAVRSRFDVAHELGHLMLHRHIDPESLDKPDYKRMETQAHRFATAFLLPTDAFRRDVRRATLDTLVAIKPKWRVSVGAMIMRCAQLGIVDSYETKRLQISLSERGWRKAEPLDKDIPVERPAALREAVQLSIENGKFGREEFLDLVGLNGSDVESLAALPPSYMRREAAPVVQLRR